MQALGYVVIQLQRWLCPQEQLDAMFLLMST